MNDIDDYIGDDDNFREKIRRDCILEEHKNKMTKQEYLLQFFTYDHLPENLQILSAPFKQIADMMIEKLPRNPERIAGLRKLLEAKDCFVRAGIFKD